MKLTNGQKIFLNWLIEDGHEYSETKVSKNILDYLYENSEVDPAEVINLTNEKVGKKLLFYHVSVEKVEYFSHLIEIYLRQND